MNSEVNSIQVTRVSPDQAAEFLRNNYQHNRRLRPDYVNYLAKEMDAGRFMQTAEIHVMYRNGEPALVNGQHTCAAIVKHGKPVRVTLRKDTASEHGQIAMVYAFGHDNGLKRTFNDATGAFDIANELGLTPNQVSGLAAAIKHIRGNFRGDAKDKRFHPTDLIEDMRAWALEARLIFLYVRGDRVATKVMRKRGALAVAIVTLYYQPEKAAEFWKGISRPEEMAYIDPRMAARRVLDASIMPPGADSRVTSARLSRQLARCWNAYMRGGTLEYVSPLPDAKLVVLSGTPYNGKQTDGFLSIRNELTSTPYLYTDWESEPETP